MDESMISGEPIPVEKKKGDKVLAGTINQRGSFIISATQVGSETVLARIIHMVQEAQEVKLRCSVLSTVLQGSLSLLCWELLF